MACGSKKGSRTVFQMFISATWPLVTMFGSSLAKAQRYFGAKMKHFEANKEFKDPELTQLIEHHPTRNIKNIKSFIIKQQPPFNKNSLFVMTKTGGLVDAGMIKCLRNMYGKYSADDEKRKLVLATFRKEASQTKQFQRYKAKYTVGTCSGCFKKCKLALDHKDLSFVQILDMFLDNENLQLTDVGIRWLKRGDYVLKDDSLSEKWRDWHDDHATYQGLCRQCNSAKGSGGYKFKH